MNKKTIPYISKFKINYKQLAYAMCLGIVFFLVGTLIFPVFNKQEENPVSDVIDAAQQQNLRIRNESEPIGEAYNYTYFTPPPGSFGMGNTTFKHVNWSYFKQKFQNHFYKSATYKRYSYSNWADGSSYVGINKTWMGEYWKINITLDVPIDIYEVNISFGCDLPVLDYIDREGHEIWLNYTANTTETYQIYFNWSDIANIPGITVNKHKEDGIFWISLHRNNIPAGYYVFDPTFGTTTTGTTNYYQYANDYFATHGTPDASGTLDSISIYCIYGGTGDAMGIIYDSSMNVVAVSEERTASFSGYTWTTLNFDGESITADEEYIVGVFFGGTVGASYNAYDEVDGNGGLYREANEFDSPGYPTYRTTSWTWDTANTAFSSAIYATYTEGVANNAPTITGETPSNQSSAQALQPVVNVTVNDTDGDTMNVTFASNHSGSWVNYQTNHSVGNGSYSWSFSDADTADTTYWWRVYCNDSTVNVTETYYFSTGFGFVSDGDIDIDEAYPWCEMVEIDDNKVVAVYNGAYDLKARVGFINDTNVEWGDEVTIDADVVTITSGYQFGLASIGTDKFAVAYADDSLADDGYTKVGTVSGSTITIGLSYEFENADVEYVSACGLADDKYLIFYNDEDNSDTATGIVASVSGTVVSFGNANDVATTDYFSMDSSCAKLENDKFIVSYVSEDLDDGYVVVGTVSGTTISWGTPVVFHSGSGTEKPYYTKIIKVGSDSNHAIIAYVYQDDNVGNDDYSVRVIPVTISGTTVTTGTSSIILDHDDLDKLETISHPVSRDDDEIVLAYIDSTDGFNGKAVKLTIDWDTRTISDVGNHIIFDSNDIVYSGFEFIGGINLSDDEHFLLGYCDDTDSDDLEYVLGTFGVAENNAPTQSGEAPVSGTIDVSLTPDVYVICTDDDSDTMTASWWSNSSGSWAKFASDNTSVSTGTNITQSFANATGYNVKYYWSMNLTDGTDWSNQTYNFTTTDGTWTLVDDTINGVYTNTTDWMLVDDSINGIYQNITDWVLVDDSINGIYENTTSWVLIDDTINGIYENSTIWHLVDDSINGIYSNTTNWVLVDDTKNGVYQNTTNWQLIDDSINGIYQNTTTWRLIDDTKNGVYTNTTQWILLDDTINGLYTNTSNWILVDDTINGVYTNSTNWILLDDTINGIYTNTTEWNLIDNTINGIYQNSTSWLLLDSTKNGVYSNTTTFKLISDTINGVYTNTTLWMLISSDINGVYTNTTTWQLIDDTINGVYSNGSFWTLVDDTKNGIYQNSTTWRLIDNTINGVYTNTTSWVLIDDSINGIYQNTSNWVLIDDTINGVYINGSAWTLVDDSINGVYENSTSWHLVDDSINGVYSNTSDWMLIDSTKNGIYTNTTEWNLIDDTINGIYTNTTQWILIDSTKNGIYTNTTSWVLIDDTINGTYTNTSIGIQWYLIDSTINGIYTNSTIWRLIDNTINGTYQNTSIPSLINITITNIFPSNNSIITNLQPTLYFTINHDNGSLMNYTIYIGDNLSNINTLLTTSSNKNNGTYYYSYYNATNYTNYYWRIYVTDGYTEVNSSQTYFISRGPGQMLDTPGYEAISFIAALFAAIWIITRKRR